MPVLANPKHEAFAQYLFERKPQGEAYAEAGFTANKSAASKLANSTKLQARFRELQERAMKRHDVTIDTLTEELNEAKALARRTRNPAALTGAIMATAKLHSLDVNRNENVNTNFVIGAGPEDLDDDTWLDRNRPN